MSPMQVESIHLNPQESTNRGLSILIEKSLSPYKSTLRDNAKYAIKTLISSYLGAISNELAELFVLYPRILELVKNNPALIEITSKNPKLLYYVLYNTSLAKLVNASPELLNLLLSKPELIEELNQSTKLLAFVTKSEKILRKFIEKPLPFITALKYSKQAETKYTKPKEIDRFVLSKERRREILTAKKINLAPHSLEPEVIAKAHLENPNTGITVGTLRTISKKTPETNVIPTRPQKINNLPLLNQHTLAMAGIIAATANKTRIKNPSDREYELETQSEFKNRSEELIKSISELNESQEISKLTANLK